MCLCVDGVWITIGCSQNRSRHFFFDRGFMSLQSVNEFDCPQLELSDVFFTVPSSTILKSVSVIHECRSTCKFSFKAAKSTFERETVVSNYLIRM